MFMYAMLPVCAVRLMKAGFMPKQHEGAVSKASAWAEGIGYIANICLSMHKLEQLSLQEQQLLRKVQAHCRVSHAAIERSMLQNSVALFIG